MGSYGSKIELSGEAIVPFILGGKTIDTLALVSPDIEEVMIGADWLEQHRCVWDFGGKKLFIDGRPAVMVTRKKKLRCRRLYSKAEVIIPPKQQVEASVRSTLSSLQK